MKTCQANTSNNRCTHLGFSGVAACVPAQRHLDTEIQKKLAHRHLDTNIDSPQRLLVILPLRMPLALETFMPWLLSVVSTDAVQTWRLH